MMFSMQRENSLLTVLLLIWIHEIALWVNQSKHKQGHGKEFYSGWSRYEVIYDLCKPRQ